MVDSSDFTFSNGYLGLLSTLGALLGVICCCAPVLVPVLRKVSEIVICLISIFAKTFRAVPNPNYVFQKAREVLFQLLFQRRKAESTGPGVSQIVVTTEIPVCRNKCLCGSHFHSHVNGLDGQHALRVTVMEVDPFDHASSPLDISLSSSNVEV